MYLVMTEPGSQHTKSFCQESRKIDGETHVCSFSMRTDKLKENLRKGTLHTCNFKRVEDIRRMFQFSQSKKKKASHDDLVKALGSAVGQLNVSLESMLSPAIRKLLQVAFELGQTTQDQFSSAFSMPTRRCLRAAMLEEAKAVNNAKLDFYRQSRFVSMSIDEGTTLKTSYLNFILHDVFGQKNEYFAKSVIMHGKKAENYVISIHFGFQYCEKHELNVSSIVMDGSKAQAKAFDTSYTRGLRNIGFTTATAKKVITFPCACHLIENAYKRLIKGHNKASSLIEKCRRLGAALNDSGSSLVTCPRFVSTRWIYDYDIVKYLLENRADAIKVLKEPLPDEDKLQNMKILIGALRTLIARFESATCSVTEVYPAISATINSLYLWRSLKGGELLSLSWEGVFQEMADHLKEYFLDRPHAGLLILSHILTPQGRRAFLEAKDQRHVILPRNFRFQEVTADVDLVSQEVDELLEEGDSKITISASEKEKELMNHILAVACDPDDEDSNEDEGDTEENADGPQVNLTDALAKAYKALKVVCEITSIDTKNTLKAFDAFLEVDNYLLREHLRESVDGRWFNWHYMEQIPGFTELSEVAQRIIPTPASEASAERSISLQRAIILSKRKRAYRDLVRSREILMQAAKEDTTKPDGSSIYDIITTVSVPTWSLSEERSVVRRRDRLMLVSLPPRQ